MAHSTFDLRSRCLVASRPRFNWLLVLPALATLVTFAVLETSSASADVRVHAQAEGVQPLSPGTQIPKAVVQTILGKPMDLEAAIGEGGALLVFYRGGWWPYCNTQLGELRKIETELASLGFKVIALSPDRPEKLEQSLEVKGLGYALYSDSNLDVARRFGIVYQLDDADVAEYAKYGIDLADASGKAHHQLPVPSVFLIDPDGKILWVYSNPDYKIRPDNAKLLEAAKRFSLRPGQ